MAGADSSAADFEIRENGVVQPITNFAEYARDGEETHLTPPGGDETPTTSPAATSKRTILVFAERFSLPNSRILIHQPATEGGYGQSSDMEIQAREILRMRAAMEVILARHTGQDEEKIRRDIERDKFLTADEAKEYGIIDEVLTMIKRGSERAVEVVSSLPGEFSSSLSGR